MALLEQVKGHWENETCGTRYAEGMDGKEFYEETKRKRYELEPFILDFADFENAKGLEILEVGVGGGVDFSQWVANAKHATGIDLTQAGVEHTRKRLEYGNFSPETYTLKAANAEELPFEDEKFDLVYSWGVMHHSPDTEKCFREAYRVLKPGGRIKAMIYHTPSWTLLMLWVRWALMTGKIFKSLKTIAFENLESPGTKVYKLEEARNLVKGAGFSDIKLKVELSPGNTLSIKLSKKYDKPLYKFIQKMYPSWFIKKFGRGWGTFLLIEARKES